jgi:hypothetical protein
MQAALDVAEETEGAPIRVLNARLDPQGGDPVWRMELFVGAPDGRPKRVNLRVSASEPKVAKRVELRSLTEDEERLWELMRDSEIKAKNAINVASSPWRRQGDPRDHGRPRPHDRLLHERR